MNRSLRSVSLYAIAFLFAACNHNTAKSTPAESKKDSLAANPTQQVAPTAINTNVHNHYNDVALYLAGLKPDSAVAIPQRLQNYTFYQRYADSMNHGFNNMETYRLSKMRDWAKTELADELAHPKTVLYPFSGPDILHCVQLFPDADNYVMIAMERYGALPNMEKMDSARTHHTINYIQKSLEDIFGKSYFITKKMINDVSNQYNGVTPLACVFLVRSGYTILDIHYKHLEEDGKTLTEIPLDSVSKRNNDCVEIYFKKRGSDKVQKLTYFKANLADDPFGLPGFKTNTALRTFLTNLPEGYTYAKSASYLMNQNNFNAIREVCLHHSRTIVQDDTGIAYRFIDKKKWKVQLYGNYVKPVSDFKGGYYQPDLNAAYHTDSIHIKPLPFSLGYHWRDQNQNLMKFTKL